jgi:hypothetical protein
MKQFTARTLYDALFWIHTNEHHESGVEFHPRTGKESHIYYKNCHEKLRVPLDAPWARQFFMMIRSNRRAHDDRMYALTPKAKKILFASPYGDDLDRKRHP